jgi:hypothetical protein
MNFGKYAVLDNLVYQFEKEPDWHWTFRPVSTADMLAYQRFHAQFSERERVPEWTEIAIEEIALSSASTDIPDTNLGKGGTVDDFRKLLLEMPPAMVGELWSYVGEVTPFMGPPRPPSQDQEQTEEPSQGKKSSKK